MRNEPGRSRTVPRPAGPRRHPALAVAGLVRHRLDASPRLRRPAGPGGRPRRPVRHHVGCLQPLPDGRAGRAVADCQHGRLRHAVPGVRDRCRTALPGPPAGRRYTSLPVYARAEGFLCRLCPVPRPALYWDHCHEHGLVRGPVCASCNAYEGGGTRFLDRPGAMRHLLQCEGCLQDRTVPPRHQPDIVLRTFVFAPHGACPRPPDRAFGTVEADGSVRFRLSCWQHPAQQAWDQIVPASQVRELVQAFVDAAVTGLDGDGDRPTG
ncbi:endonuclease domain-containing protein [Streptomyces sp. NBUA17]|uniref:endonuclease domain-containing protein n=1 Tax=Streptomyces sp. NBUA17 TaxID=3062275 RepID=UPI0037DA37F8